MLVSAGYCSLSSIFLIHPFMSYSRFLNRLISWMEYFLRMSKNSTVSFYEVLLSSVLMEEREELKRLMASENWLTEEK